MTKFSFNESASDEDKVKTIEGLLGIIEALTKDDSLTRDQRNKIVSDVVGLINKNHPTIKISG